MLVICKGEIAAACKDGRIKAHQNVMINLLSRLPIVPASHRISRYSSEFCYDAEELLGVLMIELNSGRLKKPGLYEELASYVKSQIKDHGNAE